MATTAASKTNSKAKKSSPAAKGNGKKACTVEGCKLAYRAKGYCFFHYKKWRAGELPHGRYGTCSNEECHKRVAKHGLCEEHLKAWQASRKGAKPEEAAAPAAQ
jgi:hypothetical protein